MEKIDSRRRWTRTSSVAAPGLGAAVVAAALVLAGCAQSTDGTAAAPASVPPLTAPAPISSGAPSATTPTPTPVSTAATTAPTSAPPVTPPPVRLISVAQLPGLLEHAPAGSNGWGNSWGNLVAPSPRQFVNHVYGGSYRDTALAQLQAQGLTTVVHRTWIARDRNQADVVLLRFKTVTGASTRYLTATANQGNVPNITKVSVPGRADAVGFRSPGVDSDGYVRSIFYVAVRNVAVELFYYSPKKFTPADAFTWLRAQAKALA